MHFLIHVERRENSTQRGYNWRWRKYRDGFLRKHPLCAMHLQRGVVVPATVVDHIEPHRGDSKRFWEPSNHQALCDRCHSSHKQRLEKGGGQVGCDTSGVPLDPDHHWARGG